MTGVPKPLYGLGHTPRSLEEVVSKRAAADYSKGITKCPFTTKRMKNYWQVGWDAARQLAEKKEETDD